MLYANFVDRRKFRVINSVNKYWSAVKKKKRKKTLCHFHHHTRIYGGKTRKCLNEHLSRNISWRTSQQNFLTSQQRTQLKLASRERKMHYRPRMSKSNENNEIVPQAVEKSPCSHERNQQGQTNSRERNLTKFTFGHGKLKRTQFVFQNYQGEGDISRCVTKNEIFRSFHPFGFSLQPSLKGVRS